MKFFNHELAIDLGTANTVIFQKGLIALDDPSIVAIPEISVIDVLRKRKQTAITAWIFPAFLNPEQPIHPAAAYRKLKVILKNAELPLIRFHDLRHTFATHAMKGGVDAKTLSGILGHTNASFTLDTYTHVTSDMQKSASAVVGNMMQIIMIKEQ